MLNKYKISIISAVFILFTACSNADSTDKKTSAYAPTSNNNIVAANVNSPTANQLNAEIKNEKQTLSPPVSANGNLSDANIKVTKIDPTKKLPNPVVTLGDGSQMSASLNEKGAVETRTFINNPQITKIERTTVGNDISIKVFLKNGKVIPIGKDKIRDFANESVDQILLAAGIGPVTAPPNAGKQPQIKKEGNVQTYTF